MCGYQFSYDNLNYPKRIHFTNGNTTEYVYAPDGQKLRATNQTAAGNVVGKFGDGSR